MYISGDEKQFDLAVEKKVEFKIKDEFLSKLLEVKIPLILERKKDLRLNDIYVFPDIDVINRDINSFENYINSIHLLDAEYDHCILDGEAQVGKTSLLSMLFIKMQEKGIHPVYLRGEDIKDENVDKVVKRAFKQQYAGSENDYDRYLQLSRSKRGILIDDFQDCNLGSNYIKEFFDSLILKFGKIITILDSANSILSSLKSVIREAKYYTIKPFGHKKRNELIERYIHLK